PPGQHFLIVSALVPYKRIDVAIDACRRAGASLRIVGDGPDRARLERHANGSATTPGGSPSTSLGTSRVEFIGRATNDEIRDEYRRALAVLLPGEEDFGIVPVEAQACGRPVVALGRGGALETVIDGETGVFFEEPTVESLAAALGRVGRLDFDSSRIRAHAE